MACSWTAVIPMLRRLCKISWQYWFSPFPWQKINLDASCEKEVPCRPWNKTGKTAQILLLLDTWNFHEQTGWVLRLETSHLSLLPQQQCPRNQFSSVTSILEIKGKDIMRWLFAFDFHKYSELVNTIPKPWHCVSGRLWHLFLSPLECKSH